MRLQLTRDNGEALLNLASVTLDDFSDGGTYLTYLRDAIEAEEQEEQWVIT